ncbi:MAG: energy transducer TonB [bacterium]|nr:energy transducer TonB [bacterium]
MKSAKRHRLRKEISKLLLYLSVLGLLICSTASSDVVGEYAAVISAHQVDIEELARGYSDDDYEVTGLVTLEFNITGDGSVDVRLLGSSVAHPAFNDALLAEAESWEFRPHSEAEVIIYEQFVIGDGYGKPAGSIIVGDAIPGADNYAASAKKVIAEMERTRKSMDYRYGLYLGDHPGSGGFALLFLYIGDDGYVSRVSTKYSGIQDYTFRGEIEGWIKANVFPDGLPPGAVVAFPLCFEPQGGYTSDADAGEYQRCLMGYKDILKTRYADYSGGEGGEVNVTVDIDAAGTVISVVVGETTIAEEGFVELIPVIIGEWRFPAGAGGELEFTFKL